jgi:phospholipid transport system substrate-binding protein
MRRNHREPRSTVPGIARTLIIALAGLVWASQPLPALAAAPQDTVRHLIAGVTAVLEDPALEGPAKKGERQQRIAGIIHDAFHYEDMARHSLGARWAELTPAEREEFTRLFADLFERSYSILVVRFLGERTTVYVDESRVGQRAVVRTMLVSQKDGEMPVDYRLAALGERWTVVDIVVDGVSLAENYRVQFNKIIRSSSYQTLLERMRKRVN